MLAKFSTVEVSRHKRWLSRAETVDVSNSLRRQLRRLLRDAATGRRLFILSD